MNLNAIEIKDMILKLQSMAIDGKRNIGGMFSAINITGKGERKWSCRFGVKKYLRGSKLAYNAKEKNLLTVWDPNFTPKHPKDDGYRHINCNTLQYLKVRGIVLVEGGQYTNVFMELKNS